MCSVVIQLIHLDCKTEKHTEKETEDRMEKQIGIFFSIIYSECANPKILSAHQKKKNIKGRLFYHFDLSVHVIHYTLKLFYFLQISFMKHFKRGKEVILSINK